jgi:hypothetical protein
MEAAGASLRTAHTAAGAAIGAGATGVHIVHFRDLKCQVQQLQGSLVTSVVAGGGPA